MDVYELVANWLIVALSIYLFVVKWRTYKLTRAWGVYLIMFGFVAVIVIRLGIVFHWPVLYDHSRSLTLVTYALWAVGATMLLRALEKVLRPTDMFAAAALTAQAAAAAQVAREHALDAADKAEAARLYAKRAAELADEATTASRKATRASGVASEVSREADERVGKNEH